MKIKHFQWYLIIYFFTLTAQALAEKDNSKKYVEQSASTDIPQIQNETAVEKVNRKIKKWSNDIIKSTEKWANKVTFLNELVTENKGLELEPETQRVYFESLQKVYDDRIVVYRDGIGEKTDLSSLKKMLADAEKSTFISSIDKDTIKRLQETLLFEETLFALGNESSYEQQYVTAASLMDQSKNHTYDSFIQTTFFNKMCTLFNSKRLDEYRNDQKTLKSILETLEKADQTPLLTKQQQRYLHKTIYTPQQKVYLNCKIQTEIQEALNNKNLEHQRAELLALSKKSNSLTVSGETQNQFMHALQSVYDRHNNSNQHELRELKKLCKAAVTSPLLSSAHKKEVSTALTPKLETTIDNISLQNNITFALSQTVYTDFVQNLADIFQKIGKTSLTPDTISMLSKACTHLFERREDDETILRQLKKFYDTISNTTFLTASCKTSIEKEFLPTLSTEIENKVFYNDLNNVNNAPAQERMNLFHKFLTTHSSKALDKKNEALLSNTIDSFFVHRTQEKKDLETVHDFFLKIKNNPLISHIKKTTILNEYLPALKRDKNDLELSEELSNSNNFYQLNERINAVISAIQKTYGKEYNPVSQDLLHTVVNDLVDQRVENKSTLSKLNELLNASQKSLALSSEHKKHVQNNLLPLISEDLDVIYLKRASSLPEYNEKITELTHYINQSHTKFSSRVNESYIEALHSAFDQRPYENLVELKNFAQLLEKSQTRLRDDNNKKKVTQQFLPLITKDINSLSFKHDMHAVMAQKSVLEKLKALPEIVQRYSDKPLIESAQKLLGENLQSLFDQRYTSLNKQEINEKMKVTKHMVQCFKDAYNTTLLNPTEKQHLAKNLIPVLTNEEIGLSIQAKIELIGKRSTNSKIIEGLKNLIDETKGTTYNTETQDCYAQHLQILTSQAKMLDNQTLHELQDLLDQTQHTTLLSPSQSHFVATNLKPTISSIIVRHDLDRIAQAAPTEQIENLQQLLTHNAHTTLLPETQDAYAQLLQQINLNAETLDPQSVQKLEILLQASTETSLLTPAQQAYIQNNMIPALRATTVPQRIELMKGSYSIDKQIDELYTLTQSAEGRTYPAPTKNAYGTALVELSQSCKKLDFTTHAKLEKLLHAATNTPLLTESQQNFFKTKILPSVTLSPTPETIHHIMTIESISDQLISLQKMVQGAQTPCCSNTKNAFESSLIQLSQTAEKLQNEDRTNLIDLIKLSTKSPLLSFTQQQYFRKTVLPKVSQETTPSSIHRIMSESSIEKQIASLTELVQYSRNKEYPAATKNTFGSSLVQLAQQAEKLPLSTRAQLQRLILKSTKTPLLNEAQQNFFKEKILPSVAIHITPTTINELLHHGTITDQIAWLKSLIELPTQGTYNAQIRNSFGKSLTQLANHNTQMNEQERNKLLHLLVKASNSKFLNQTQQEYVKNSMIPLIYKETTP